MYIIASVARTHSLKASRARSAVSSHRDGKKERRKKPTSKLRACLGGWEGAEDAGDSSHMSYRYKNFLI